MNMLFRTILAAVLLGLGSAAHAFVPPTITIGPPFAMAKLQRELLERRVEEREPRQQDEQAAPVSPGVKFTFTPSRSRTQTNLRSFVARTPNPAARAELEQMFAAQPTLMDDIRAGIQPYGLDSHNVADAFAMWWIMAWLASEVRMQEPDREMAQNVSRQVRNAFAASPDFARTTDAARQEYAEALLLQALILAELIKAAGANPEIKAQLPAIAQKGAKDSGIDLSQMTLTQAGFVPRKTK